VELSGCSPMLAQDRLPDLPNLRGRWKCG
jgi:hypothetical protein